MARSFFTGDDAQLYTGSAAFAAQITATPTAFGLQASDASAYAALNTAYASAYMAAANPETRTKGTIAARNSARDSLRLKASDLAKIIDGTSTVTDQQKLDLGLSVRKVPSPVPAPGTPGSFKVTLGGDGSLDLTWKCNNPAGSSGTIYQVFRRTTAEGEFEYLGGSGSKSFLDTTVPAGATAVTYKIQAVRSTAVGPWAQFNVNFGTSGGGGGAAMMTASVGETPGGPKMAA